MGDSDVSGDSANAVPQVKQALPNRRALMWAHIILGMAVALAYISQLHVVFTAKYFGMLALVPYGISYGHASRLVTNRWIRTSAFILVLFAGSAAAAWLLLGAYGPVRFPMALLLFGAQTLLYLITGDALLRVG